MLTKPDLNSALAYFFVWKATNKVEAYGKTIDGDYQEKKVESDRSSHYQKNGSAEDGDQ